MKKFYTASNKRRPDHPRPRAGYEGNPSSVFKTPTPATTHCVKQPMEHVWEKATRARGPSTLTWRLPLREAQREDVRPMPLWQIHIKLLGNQAILALL
jgi:hypothetical protein